MPRTFSNSSRRSSGGLEGPVELVHEGENRDAALAANFKKLAGLGLDALGGIDHHDGGIDGGKHTIGVFREILVAGVSSKLTTQSPYSNCSTVDETEMPRWRSSSTPIAGSWPAGPCAR